MGARTSRTAPTQGGQSQGMGSRRMPNTKSAGNLTRRTNNTMPRRRSGGNNNKENEPAVGGIGGIRLLRQKK